MEYYGRAPTLPEVTKLQDKMNACFNAAATATGCTVLILYILCVHNVERLYLTEMLHFIFNLICDDSNVIKYILSYFLFLIIFP